MTTWSYFCATVVFQRIYQERTLYLFVVIMFWQSFLGKIYGFDGRGRFSGINSTLSSFFMGSNGRDIFTALRVVQKEWRLTDHLYEVFCVNKNVWTRRISNIHFQRCSNADFIDCFWRDGGPDCRLTINIDKIPFTVRNKTIKRSQDSWFPLYKTYEPVNGTVLNILDPAKTYQEKSCTTVSTDPCWNNSKTQRKLERISSKIRQIHRSISKLLAREPFICQSALPISCHLFERNYQRKSNSNTQVKMKNPCY